MDAYKIKHEQRKQSNKNVALRSYNECWTWKWGPLHHWSLVRTVGWELNVKCF